MSYNIVKCDKIEQINELRLQKLGELRSSDAKAINASESIPFENTLDYFWNNVTSGLYVIVKDGLKLIIHFNNLCYRNNWSNIVSTPNKKSWLGYLNTKKYYSKFKNKSNMEYNTDISDTDLLDHLSKKKNIIKKNYFGRMDLDMEKWTTDNCLVNYCESNTSPLYQSTNIKYIAKLLDESSKGVKGVREFFINLKAYPIMRKDKCEPYTAIFGEGVKIPNTNSLDLKSNAYSTEYLKIFSFCTSDKHVDIAIPNYEDLRANEENSNEKKISWGIKKSQAVFRGSATGMPVTETDNQRLAVCALNESVLDAKLTKLNTRDRFVDGMLKYIDPYSLSFNISLDYFLSFVDQCKYKYILNIDGFVSAYRLGKDFSSGSTVIKMKSPGGYKLWFDNLLKENKNYLSVDLKTLIPKIKWCIKNDSKARKIADAGKKLYDNALSYKHQITYVRSKLI